MNPRDEWVVILEAARDHVLGLDFESQGATAVKHAEMILIWALHNAGTMRCALLDEERERCAKICAHIAKCNEKQADDLQAPLSDRFRDRAAGAHACVRMLRSEE
jgi:hypothetical protein